MLVELGSGKSEEDLQVRVAAIRRKKYHDGKVEPVGKPPDRREIAVNWH